MVSCDLWESEREPPLCSSHFPPPLIPSCTTQEGGAGGGGEGVSGGGESKSRGDRGFKGRGVRGFSRVQCPGGLARFGEVRAAQRLVLVRAQAFLRVALSQFSPDSI